MFMNDQVFLATKFGVKGLANGTRVFSNEPEYIRKAIDGSLARLKTDYVDLWYWLVYPLCPSQLQPFSLTSLAHSLTLYPLFFPQPPLRRQSPRRNNRLNHGLRRPRKQSPLPRPLRVLLLHPPPRPRHPPHPRRPNRILPLHPRHRVRSRHPPPLHLPPTRRRDRRVQPAWPRYADGEV